MEALPLSYRGHGTLPSLNPAYIIQRISPQSLCITNTHMFFVWVMEFSCLFFHQIVRKHSWNIKTLSINIHGWAGFDSSWVWLWLTWVLQYRSESCWHTKASLPWLYLDTQTLYTRMHTLSQDPVCQLSISCPLAWASSRLMSTTYIWNQTPPRIPPHAHSQTSFSTGNSGKGGNTSKRVWSNVGFWFTL